ncbi:MAG: PadR family transcriptional regulator [Acidimicrobiales bacterium]|jgi:DNA-binding PadR family transcriptional regulator|nr:PadR family transcriptional regulator [Acidimicrobiales bacterium]
MRRQLSTTGYAVLGLLALRPLTPYEITQQMQRSLDYCWPTSERSLYDQPERLVAAGYAMRQEPDGDRAARYEITAAGRDALRAWLATDSAMPRFQNEPMLRALFADQGTVADLHRTIDDLRAHVAQRRRLGVAQMEPYLTGDGLFQERSHIVTLTADLVARVLDAIEDWADEVAQVTAGWTTTEGLGLTDEIRPILERIVTEGNERVRRAAEAADATSDND